MLDLNLLHRFAHVFTGPTPAIEQDARLRIVRDGDLSIYYVPFESFNAAARIVIVGITPGPNQIKAAYPELRRHLVDGEPDEKALYAAKRAGAFAGDATRPNLVRQLNRWRVHEWLGLRDSNELFMTCGESLVQTTSLVRNAVFVKGEAYSGSPKLYTTAVLREQLFEHFIPEIKALPDALIFPLGSVVDEVIAKLVERRDITVDRVMPGLVHPSGRNTYRINWVLSDRTTPAPHLTDPRAFDRGQERFAKFTGMLTT